MLRESQSATTLINIRAKEDECKLMPKLLKFLLKSWQQIKISCNSKGFVTRLALITVRTAKCQLIIICFHFSARTLPFCKLFGTGGCPDHGPGPGQGDHGPLRLTAQLIAAPREYQRAGG